MKIEKLNKKEIKKIKESCKLIEIATTYYKKSLNWKINKRFPQKFNLGDGLNDYTLINDIFIKVKSVRGTSFYKIIKED